MMAESIDLTSTRNGDIDPKASEGASASPLALLECGYYEVDQVQYIAEALLQTLASACVEKTAGDPFNTPSSVVIDLKKELTDYLDFHSKAYAAGNSTFYIEETPSSVSELVDVFLDDFVSSKMNLFSKVSSIVLSRDKKDDKIEELVSRLDRRGAWLAGNRETLAKAIINTVDTHKLCHCDERFSSIEELAKHKLRCYFRPLNCSNEGCADVFCAYKAEEHDAACSWKLLDCEQGCISKIRRAEMDKHCLTVCPMKLVTCPFLQAGCQDNMPESAVEDHLQQSLGHHLLLVLKLLQEQNILISNQAQKNTLLEQALVKQTQEAVDTKALALLVKEQEVKIKTVELELNRLRHLYKTADVSAEGTKL